MGGGMLARGVAVVAIALAAFAGAAGAWAVLATGRERLRRGALAGAALRSGDGSGLSGERDGALASAVGAGILQRGVPALLPVGRLLLRWKPLASVCDDAVLVLFRRGVSTQREPLLSFAVAILLGTAFAVGLIGRSVVSGLAALAAALVVAVLWVRMQRDRLFAEIRDEIPDLLQSIEACFLSGMTLQQTFLQAASESKGYVRSRMLHCAHIMQAGGSASEALAVLKRETAVPEMAFLAVALDVQHRTGGSMRQMLDAVQEVAKNKLDLARELRVQTAQASLSARVVSALPFVLLAVFSLMSPDFLLPFFSSAPGAAVFVLACGMQAVGIVLVRKILRAGASE